MFVYLLGGDKSIAIKKSNYVVVMRARMTQIHKIKSLI